LAALLAALSAGLGFASAARADVVISELRGSGTTAEDDYVELFNRGAAPVNKLGWRLDARAGDDGAAGTVTLPLSRSVKRRSPSSVAPICAQGLGMARRPPADVRRSRGRHE